MIDRNMEYTIGSTGLNFSTTTEGMDTDSSFETNAYHDVITTGVDLLHLNDDI
jgi:hypothetical protein